MTALVADVVTSNAGMLRVIPEWEELWRRLPARSPFQSPAWLLAWWRQFGTERPVLALLRDDARLVALFPAYVLIENDCRKLLPMGIGITDYLDALVAPEAPRDAATRLVAIALDAAHDVASCDLIDLPPDAALREAAPPSGWRIEAAESISCPVLRLPQPGAELHHTIPARMHRKLRMSRHRADRIGGWITEIADERTISGALDALMELHGERWTSRGEPGVLADPRVVRFHRDAGRKLLANGTLRLYTLRLGGTIAAACMTLLAPPARLLLYLSGFDAAHAFESPGTIVLGAIIEDAIRAGLREVHFLRGREDYKYAWGATDRMNSVRRFLPE